MVRRRITACGVPPLATGAPPCANCSRYGAGEPTTGASFWLERPGLHTVTFHLGLDPCAQAFPEAFNLVVLDHGALHKAQARQWPSHVGPVFLPPYRPELNPMERVWRDRKDQLADVKAKTCAALSDAVYAMIRHDSPATLQSLPGFPSFGQAVETAQEAVYG